MSLLTVENLGIGFGGVRALDGVSFAVPARGILCIIGPNGAGKSTLFNVITRHYRADTGRVLFEGQDITAVRPEQIAARGIARTFQNIELFDRATVLQNLMLGRHLKRGCTIFDEILRTPRFRRAELGNRQKAEDVIELLGLQRHRNSVVGQLPYGLRKMVELARALCLEPRLLLLDEPSSGLNVEETDELALWLREVRSLLGLTIVMIEHNMRLVGALGESVLALVGGRVAAQGSPHEVRNHPEVMRSYLGAEAA